MEKRTVDIEEPESLRVYLRAEGYLSPSEPVASRKISGGVSNRTVLLERPGKSDWVLKQALSKLRVEADWYCDPARIHREAAGLRWLQRLLPDGATPRLVFEDRTHHVLAMTAVPQPHENWKTMLLAGRLQERHVEQFAGLLAVLHRAGYEHRRGLRSTFGDRSFFEALRIEPYYAYTAERVPAARRFLGDLIEEMRHVHESLVHGDYSPKNVLVHDGRLVLLDHEVIHFGDPAFDVGFSLTHLLSKAHHVARDAFANAARRYTAIYLAETADLPWRQDFEARAVRHLTACLLARVDGRSPLEYLNEAERARQRAAVLGVLEPAPDTLQDFIDAFLRELHT